MATSTIVPLEEYLHTSYEPECEWIDGVLKEKTMPDEYHGYFQAWLLNFFNSRQLEFGLRALSEVRLRALPTHHRVPDVLVIQADAPFLPRLSVTPLLCIEVLSPDDRKNDLLEKVDDYVKMGVFTIWIIDPRRRTIAVADAGGIHPVVELALQGTNVKLTAADMFAELDQLEAM